MTVKKRTRTLREKIPDGEPEALSWDETPWEYDDYAVSCVKPNLEQTLGEVGEPMGISRERVRQLETRVQQKLGQLRAVGFNTDDSLEESKFAIRVIFDRYDKERLVKRLKFAMRVLEDEELQERIMSVYGDIIESNDSHFDFSHFVTLAKAIDRNKPLQLKLVKQ